MRSDTEGFRSVPQTDHKKSTEEGGKK